MFGSLVMAGSVACYSEPSVIGGATGGPDDASGDESAAEDAPTSSAPTAGDGPEDGGPADGTGATTPGTTGGDPDSSPPGDTEPTSDGGSSDGGEAETGSTGEPAACSSGPLAATWTEAGALQTQPNPQGLAGAWIDGDELLDIAVASYDTSSVSIYLGDGAGGFELGTQIFSPGNASRVQLAAIADDTPDLFVQYYNAATFETNLQRWRGDGSGNFQFGMGLGPVQSLALGRFNGDAYLDVVKGVDGMLELRAGDVTENFGPAVSLGDHSGNPVAGDLDDDGDDDLVMATGTSATVLLNDNGVFAAQPSIGLGSPIGVAVLGDPNDDGNLDLVTGTFGGGVTIAQVFPGDGAGGLGAALPFPISNYTSYAAAKDMDADGIDDLLLAAPSGSLTLLRSGGDGTMQSEDVTAVAGCQNVRGLVAEDLNDDCIPDPIIVCSGAVGEVRVFVSEL